MARYRNTLQTVRARQWKLTKDRDPVELFKDIVKEFEGGTPNELKGGSWDALCDNFLLQLHTTGDGYVLSLDGAFGIQAVPEGAWIVRDGGASVFVEKEQDFPARWRTYKPEDEDSLLAHHVYPIESVLEMMQNHRSASDKHVIGIFRDIARMVQESEALSIVTFQQTREGTVGCRTLMLPALSSPGQQDITSPEPTLRHPPAHILGVNAHRGALIQMQQALQQAPPPDPESSEYKGPDIQFGHRGGMEPEEGGLLDHEGNPLT